MEGFQFFLLISQIFIAVILVILVLLQKSDGDSLSGISSAPGSLSGAISRRTSANILTKATWILIVIFMVNCLLLTSLSNRANKALKADLEKAAATQTTEVPADATKATQESPSAPVVPPVK